MRKFSAFSDHTVAKLTDFARRQFSTFNVTFPEHLRGDVMTAVWKRVVDILLSILVPPLSDKESHGDPPSPQEVTVVFQWLKVCSVSAEIEEEVLNVFSLAVLEVIFQRG